MSDFDINLKGNAEAGIKAIGKALKDAERDTKSAQKAVEQLAKEAEKAAKEAEKNSLGEMFKKSQIGANLATAAMEKFAEKLVEFLQNVPEANARAEAHAQALSQLGGAYDQVRSATNGVVTADQAAAVSSRLAQAGIRLSAQELAAVTQRAREFARVNRMDVGQALDQLTTQIRDGGDGLREFGITIQAGRTKTENASLALRQLVEQAGRTRPAAVSASEAQAMWNASLTQAGDSVSAFLARGVGLTEFFVQASTYLDELTDGTRDWSEALGEAFSGTVVEAFGGRSTTTRTAGQASSFGARYGATIDELRRAGVDTRQYPMAGQLVSLSADEQARVLAIIQRDVAQRRGQAGQRTDNLRGAAAMFRQDTPAGPTLGGEGPTETSAQAIANVGESAQRRAADVRLTAEKRRRLEEQQREQERRAQIQRELAAAMGPTDPNALRAAQMAFAQAQLDAQTAGVAATLGMSGGAGDPTQVRQARLDALQRSATATEAQRGENEAARLQRVASAVEAYVQALRQYREEDERLETQLRASAQAEKDRTEAIVEGLRAGEDAQRRRMADTLGRSADELQARRGIDAAQNPGAAGDARRQRERQQELVTLRTAYEQLIAQTDARIQQATDEGRDQRALNELYQERLGLLRAMGSATQELSEIQREQSSATREFGSAMVSTLGGVADAFGGAVVAAIEGQKSFGAALGEMLRELLKTLAKQSIVEALKNSALGFAALAGFQPGSAAGYFTAAGLWAAVGAASGIGLAATKPSTAAPATNAPGGSDRAASARPAQLPAGSGGGPLNLNVNISGAVFTGDELTEVIARGVRRAEATGRLPVRGN
jgi:hypothetical protein